MTDQPLCLTGRRFAHAEIMGLRVDHSIRKYLIAFDPAR